MKNYKPDQLTSLFNGRPIDPARCTHIAIDFTKRFCDPAHGGSRGRQYQEIPRYVAQTVMPAFNKVGIQNLLFWYWQNPSSGTPAVGQDLYCVHPLPGDAVVQKEDISAFADGRLDRRLQENDKDIVILSGFHAVEPQGCLTESAVDSSTLGYTTLVMTDCIDYSVLCARGQQRLKDAGVILTTSRELLPRIVGLRRS